VPGTEAMKLAYRIFNRPCMAPTLPRQLSLTLMPEKILQIDQSDLCSGDKKRSVRTKDLHLSRTLPRLSIWACLLLSHVTFALQKGF